MVQNPPTNAGDESHGFDPWVGKIPGAGHGNPWTEEPGRLQSMGSQSQTRLSMHTQVEGIEQSSNTLDTGGYRAACSVKSTVQSNASKSRENR